MSEAAKPADPERALAALEHLWLRARQEMELRAAGKPNRLPAAAVEMGEVSATAWGWLLPLARAGLRCDALERELEVRLLEESEKREALEQEFEACVRVLSRLTEIDVLSTDGVMYRLTASSVAAIALAQPLAAAVLRSPEPATPVDGGA